MYYNTSSNKYQQRSKNFNINNGFLTDGNSDSTATTNTSSPSSSYTSSKKPNKADGLIYTVSDKYSNDDNNQSSSRRNSYNNEDLLIKGLNPNHNRSTSSISNENDNYQIKIKRNNKSEPAFSKAGRNNLLNPSSIIIDASNISTKNKSSSNELTSKLNKSNKIRTGDFTLVTQKLDKISKENESKDFSSFTDRLSNNLKSPFVYVPLIIFVLVGIVGVIAGATYIFLFKSLSLVNSNKTNTTSGINNQNLDSTYLFNFNTTDFNKNLTLPDTCGSQIHKPNLQRVRIIGGYQAMPKTWPWTVSIAYFGSRTSLPHACGGSLVNKRFVITATHCAIAQNIFNLVGHPIKGSSMYGSLAQMMRVYVGVTTRSTDINQRDTYRVLNIKSYPNFDSNSFQNDLTILELEKDVVESDSVGYICLSRNSVLDPGTDVYAVGWGFTNNNFYAASNSLMQVKFQVQSVNTCGLTYMPVVQFCAGNPTLVKDTCNGDSGGPIMQYLNNKWNLVGIVSNGDAMCTGKGIYTNISHYFDWIVKNIIIT